MIAMADAALVSLVVLNPYRHDGITDKRVVIPVAAVVAAVYGLGAMRRPLMFLLRASLCSDRRSRHQKLTLKLLPVEESITADECGGAGLAIKTTWATEADMIAGDVRTRLSARVDTPKRKR